MRIYGVYGVNGLGKLFAGQGVNVETFYNVGQASLEARRRVREDCALGLDVAFYEQQANGKFLAVDVKQLAH